MKEEKQIARNIAKYDRDLLIGFLKEMMKIRRFEEKAGQMYGLRKIGGFCHLYNGQEAVAVGAVAAIDLTKDYVLTAYRDHGHALACGMEPNALMAELFGKITGCSRGKGGSMHLFDVKNRMYGGNGIVGAHIPVATGVAFASKYRGENGVTLCFFGDGAIHQGAFHESLNMARIWNLPIVYICENNHFGMGTDFRRVSAIEEFEKMGVSYDIRGMTVDGMNVLEVYEAVKEAAADARGGNPVLMDIKTYRYKGHSMSDPATYRTREELDRYKLQDPILIMQKMLQDGGLIGEEEYKAIDMEARETAQKAVEFAEASEEPALHTIYEDVLADSHS
jgi:pyruvate dehydrogenase E1 component alpha subunit